MSGRLGSGIFTSINTG